VRHTYATELAGSGVSVSTLDPYIGGGQAGAGVVEGSHDGTDGDTARSAATTSGGCACTTTLMSERERSTSPCRFVGHALSVVELAGRTGLTVEIDQPDVLGTGVAQAAFPGRVRGVGARRRSG
jgi:hypothetical protein